MAHLEGSSMATNKTETQGYADQARPFGFFLALLILAFGCWRYFSGGTHAWYWIGAAAVVALATTVFPRIWTPVLRVWMPLAHVLGWVNTHIILGIVFYLMITPMAWVLRLFRHDPLRLRTRRGESEWIKRDHELTPASFKEPF